MPFTEEHIKPTSLSSAGCGRTPAAIELARNGEVLVVTKDAPTESSSEYAQGGVAVALSDEDEILDPFRGHHPGRRGLCLRKAVGTLVEEGPTRIRELISGRGIRQRRTKLAFTQEAPTPSAASSMPTGDSTAKRSCAC